MLILSRKKCNKTLAPEKFSNGLAEEVFLLDKKGCLL